jgi:hypothetical protein
MTVSLSRLEQDLQRVFKVYEGMDSEYIKLIRKHHSVATNQDLTMQAKNKDREATKEAVQELKRRYFEKAKAEIDKLREAYRPKVETPKLSSAERLLNVTLWTQTLPTATAAELRELYLEHKGNEDFMQLLEAQFRQRKDDLGLQQLKHEIANEPEDRALARLQKVEDAISFLAGQHFYPAKLESTEHFELRDVGADLDRYPISDGPTFRPVFDIK